MIPASTTFRATLVGLCVAGGLALVPAAAQADQYPIDVCRNWDTGAPAPVIRGVEASGGVFGNSCASADPNAGLTSTVNAPMTPQTLAIIGLRVPGDLPSLRIERVETAYRSPASGGAVLAFLRFSTAEAVLASPVTNNGPLAPVEDHVLAAPTRYVQWDIYCSNNPGTCDFASPTVLTLTRTRLFLNENVPPVLNVNGGALPGLGQKSGQQSVTFDATDADSGVASVSVSLGGIVVGGVDYRCPHTDWSACPRDELNQILQVDTTKVPDGNRELVMTIRDAANNVVPKSYGVVSIANGPASVPNGANPSRLAKITARFTTTKKTSRRLRFRSTPTVKGTLVNESGQPITGATVAILARQRRSGAQPVQIATAQTGADGAFGTKLPSGSSRTITFAYTAFSTDPKPAATAVLRTTVRAVVSASISPRSTSAGKRIRLTGRLRLLPRKGVEIKIQARDGRNWRTVDDVRTNSRGTFSWPYRFRPSARGRTFAFRARVASPIYPFAAANSKTLTVRVR